MIYKLLLSVSVFALSFSLFGCQRMHTETSGGGQAAISPQYDADLINTDPNLAGDRFSQRVESN